MMPLRTNIIRKRKNKNVIIKKHDIFTFSVVITSEHGLFFFEMDIETLVSLSLLFHLSLSLFVIVKLSIIVI